MYGENQNRDTFSKYLCLPRKNEVYMEKWKVKTAKNYL